MTTVRRAPAGTWVRWSLSVASFFVAWELLGRTRRFFAISPFSEVLPKLLEALRSKELWSATAGTLWIALVGFLIAAVVGISLGTLTGASRLAADVLDPFINAAYGTPMSMLIPVLGIYVGLDMRGKVFLVF